MSRQDSLRRVLAVGEGAPSAGGVMLELDRRWSLANGVREPQVGERYVVFDDRGWLGIGEVAHDCGCRIGTPARECPDGGSGAATSQSSLSWTDAAAALARTAWGCSLRWIARAPRAADAVREPSFVAEALGPTRERWEKLRFLRFGTPRERTCPEGVICTVSASPMAPVGWETTSAIDLDDDGSADVESRARRDCVDASKAGYGELMLEVRVRDGQTWIPVQRQAMPSY
jgi:hypothetical protein